MQGYIEIVCLQDCFYGFTYDKVSCVQMAFVAHIEIVCRTHNLCLSLSDGFADGGIYDVSAATLFELSTILPVGH
jgi:hypothetical protein